VVIGTFAGDWMTAAKLYREWAVRQVWCSAGKREARTDVPQWYKDLAVWEFITANSYGAMHHYRNMLGVPWANHWNYIWKDASQGDKGSPDLFPPKGGEAQMREETAKLAKAGVYAVPYFLGSALDVKSPQYAQWKMDSVLVRGGESHYALGNPNTPYIWVYGPEMQFAWPWPKQPPWNTRTVTRPAVIHSAWRTSDGSVGVVFLNISEQPQRFALCLEGEQWGFPREADLSVAALGLGQAENPTREPLAPLSRGKGRIEHTLEPRGMWALEVKLTQCPKRGTVAPQEGRKGS
jgi:hypothetical protein